MGAVASAPSRSELVRGGSKGIAGMARSYEKPTSFNRQPARLGASQAHEHQPARQVTLEVKLERRAG